MTEKPKQPRGALDQYLTQAQIAERDAAVAKVGQDPSMDLLECFRQLGALSQKYRKLAASQL